MQVRIIILSLLFTLGFLSTQNIEAQNRRKVPENTEANEEIYGEDETVFRNDFFVGSYLRSPAIFSTGQGGQMNIGIQPFIGYKKKFFGAGLTTSVDLVHNWYNNSSSGNTFVNFGTTAFGRFIVKQYFLQVEAGYIFLRNPTTKYDTFPVAYVGVGANYGGYEVIFNYRFYNTYTTGTSPFDYKGGFVFYF